MSDGLTKDEIIRSHVERARETNVEGHSVLIVNATIYECEIATELAKGRPFGVTWYENGDNTRLYCLRAGDGSVDVCEIAKKYGGAGLGNVAGFTAPATGATGIFHEKSLGENDEGELRMMISIDQQEKLVLFDFGRLIRLMALKSDDALRMAAAIKERAEEIQDHRSSANEEESESRS